MYWAEQTFLMTGKMLFISVVLWSLAVPIGAFALLCADVDFALGCTLSLLALLILAGWKLLADREYERNREAHYRAWKDVYGI